jgi:glycosyltransferase involved in cell wall biosynthesis
MNERYDVGVVATHIEPAKGYGGVAVSVARLTRTWAGHQGRRIALCASDASEGGSIRSGDIHLGDNVKVQLFHAYWFRRWGFGLSALLHLFRLCLRSDAIYIHGIATWPNTLAAIFCCLLGRPFVVAPRGGLMPEHVKHIRSRKHHKWWFYRLLTLPTLRRAKVIHCTGAIEAQAVKVLLGEAAPVMIIPNGISVNNRHIKATTRPPSAESLTLCYVGRIQVEKGINVFIRLWLEERRSADKFIVAGGGRPGSYINEFLRLVEVADGAIEHRGYLDRDGVTRAIEDSHFLVLPSGLEGDIRENFGNAVAEALAVGRPALVTRGLAWDELETSGAGMVFEREPAGVRKILRQAACMDQAAWLAMTGKARHYAEQHLDIDVLAERVWRLVKGP